MRVNALLAAALMFGFSSAAMAQGDAANGQKVFAKCKACHTIEAGGPNRVGPNLNGIFGRAAGTKEGFAYSEAMKSSGITWNDATLTEYVSDPKGRVPGNKMAFVGIKKADEMADLLAYMRDAAK